jgi:hypothetical protein
MRLSSGPIVMLMGVLSPPVISCQRGFSFELTPDKLWDRIGVFDEFESSWPWLSDFWVEGSGLQTGSVLHGSITPPLPYHMDVRVEFVHCDRPNAITATIGGDLVGKAQLCLRPEAGGTLAEVDWTIEMRQPAMRLASRIGHPVLQWGHDRVVEMTVAGLRRRISDSRAAGRSS